MGTLAVPYNITANTEITANPHQANYTAIEDFVNTYLIHTDGTNAMTGELLLSGSPSSANGAATKSYVDTADALKAPLASPTFTGTATVPTLTVSTSASIPTLTVSTAATVPTPSSGGHATTKTYVDNAVAGVVTAQSSATSVIGQWSEWRHTGLTCGAGTTSFTNMTNEDSDPAGWYPGTGDTWTCPTTGIYAVTFLCKFSTGAAGNIAIIRRSDGEEWRVGASTTTQAQAISNSITIKITAAQTLKFQAFNAGSSDTGLARVTIVRVA